MNLSVLGGNDKIVDLVIEKVSDINSDYPYLCIYFQYEKESFMEIAINRDDQYELVFYSHKENITISHIQFTKIIEHAKSFKEEVLLNKAFY